MRVVRRDLNLKEDFWAPKDSQERSGYTERIGHVERVHGAWKSGPLRAALRC